MPDSAAILVFCRLIGLALIAPFWGQTEIPAPIRILVMMSVAGAVSHLVPAAEPLMSAGSWVGHIIIELLIGFFLGAIGRLMLAILDMIGQIISFQMGLSFTTVVNPAMQSQTTLVSLLLTQCGVVLMLSANIHHLFLRGLIDSYYITLSTADGAAHLTRNMGIFFSAALRLSTPFLVLHVVVQATLGLLNRFVPSLSFFAVSLPLQLWSGLLVLLATIGVILKEFPYLFSHIWPS